jgi:hypothetical protein
MTRSLFISLTFLALVLIASKLIYDRRISPPVSRPLVDSVEPLQRAKLNYQPRKPEIDTSGYSLIGSGMPPWNPMSSLEELKQEWDRPERKLFNYLDQLASQGQMDAGAAVDARIKRATGYLYAGQAANAYDILVEARSIADSDSTAREEWLYTVIFLQGLTSLRRGEDENCVMCRGESSCILPISPAARHTNQKGSRLAIQHFTEYLQQFPDDLGICWLLNLAHMTLGEYPGGVEPKYLVRLDKYTNSEFDIGRFRDVGHAVGIERLNWAGGAIMDDFDNDGLLDIVLTSSDPTMAMAYYRNKGDGTFEDRTQAAGLSGQYGGLNCCQADYNNDGHLDIFICRGAWVPYPMRPSLLRNNGDGTFTDVTEQAGLLVPMNTICARWADYDNDGYLDLFVCCETGPNKLFHNKGDGTFEEVAEKAGLAGVPGRTCKGAAWIDYDNDGYPDLFLNHLNGHPSKLYRNNRNGTFTDVTEAMGIDGPVNGFSCWAFDFDNDGYLDIFATCYARTLEDAVKSLQDKPHAMPTSRLYRNLGGKGFKDVTREAGLDGVYVTMGSNFGDFDNDGYLDFYLGTGAPNLEMLVPNRMFKNVAGKRFSEITASSGTGPLQKGHGVAIGDWDRNGTLDLLIESGGTTPGDRYHNMLFQNPGQGNNWLNVKLIGKKTNRSAIGARIKVVTGGEQPLTIHRHVSSGSSFGANPLEQHIGLGKANRVATLEIYWPTSGTTQVFNDIPVNQGVVITEFAKEYETRTWKPIALPK